MPVPHYWVGIDEAGYGPNLGPLVVTAIVARGSSRPPDVWRDLPFVRPVARFEPGCLCVDDSKKVMARSDGLALMESSFAALAGSLAPMDGGANSRDRRGLPDWSRLGPNYLGGEELARWVQPGVSPIEWDDPRRGGLKRRRFGCRRWRVVAARCEVIGPEKFNRLLERTGNKSDINGLAFLELLAWLKSVIPPGSKVHVMTDRHGGRHFYTTLLAQSFAGPGIAVIEETPKSSRYRIDEGSKEFEIAFVVKADTIDGLVALASMTSKLMRERWMARFNAWFARRVPELKPTAGYPVDAKRFLNDIRHILRSEGIDIDTIWRRK